MKYNLYFYTIIIAFQNFLNAENLQTNESFSEEYKELQQKYFELQFQNAQLQLNISQMMLDDSKLQLENFHLREQFNDVVMESNELLVNYSIFSQEVDNLTESFKNLKANLEKGFKRSTKDLPENCADKNILKSGVYKISKTPYLVYCDTENHNGGWTIIQRRSDGSEDFYRPWLEYKQGFGSINGEFFIGLENLHLMTSYGVQELLIIMENFDNVTKYAKYNKFEIGRDDEQYKLKVVGSHSGNLSDSFSGHLNYKFSTYDRDNDGDSNVNCARKWIGAWWYSYCIHSNLNGKYNDTMKWNSFEQTPLKNIVMMIRPATK